MVSLFGASRAVGTAYNNSFSLPSTDSTKALNLLKAHAPNESGDSEQVVVATTGGTTLTDPAVRSQVDALLARLRALPNVTTVDSPYANEGGGQMSGDRTVGFANLTYDEQDVSISTAAAKSMVKTARSFDTSTLTVAVNGQVAEKAHNPSLGGVGFGILAAAVVLFLVFGSLLAVSLPLISALIALVAATSTIGLFTHAIRMPDFTSELVPLIGLGVGVDYALFIVSRFRQGVQAGKDLEGAAISAVDTSGRAVLFAGTIVCIAMLGMFALGVSLLNGVGVAASIVVLFTMATSVTLLPAMLGFWGPRLLTRRQRTNLPDGAVAGSDGLWSRWSNLMARQPAGPALVSLVLIVALAIPFFHMRLGASDAGNDAPSTTTRQAYDLLAKGFGPGFNGPLQIVAQLSRPGDEAAFDGVATGVAHQSGVVSVTAPRVLGRNDGIEVATFEAYPTTAPQATATTRLIHNLRKHVIARAEARTGLRVYIGGDTATFADFSTVLGSKLPLFVTIVVLLSFLLLAVVFRSLVVPLMSAVMNLLSVGAAFGVLSAAYVWGWAGSPLGASRAGPIEAFIPVMMFAILFGLSMDYQVFLISRIHEEWQHTTENTEAVKRGLAISGRTITAAAAIMILVFASFILGGERIIKEFGLGLAAAILLDAFLIRVAIVPAVMFAIGNANWWFPRSLDRILPRLSVEAPDEQTSPSVPAMARAASRDRSV
jgi:RND superfamily putative drug exporter